MLNHATMKVMEAEKIKTASEAEHAKRAAFFTKAEQEVQHLEKKLKKHITKSRPYFDEKEAFNRALESQKSRVQKLQGHVRGSKLEYAKSLRALEEISESIHARRKLRMSRYKLDRTTMSTKQTCQLLRGSHADGKSKVFQGESYLNINLDEVDGSFNMNQKVSPNIYTRGVSSVSSSSCYGGSGSLEDFASTEQDLSSARSISGRSESSLALHTTAASSSGSIDNHFDNHYFEPTHQGEKRISEERAISSVPTLLNPAEQLSKDKGGRNDRVETDYNQIYSTNAEPDVPDLVVPTKSCRENERQIDLSEIHFTEQDNGNT